MTTKRADLLEPGDLLPAWGPDLLVTRVRPPRGASPLVLVDLEAEDGTTATVEYGPGTVVETSGHVPYEADEPETVTEDDVVVGDEIPDADPSSDEGPTEAEQAAIEAEEEAEREAELARVAEAERAELEADAAAQVEREEVQAAAEPTEGTATAE